MIDHVAFEVADAEFFIGFFHDVFGMEISKEGKDGNGNRQVWLDGGLQFNVNPSSSRSRGYFHHIAIKVKDLEETLRRASKYGYETAPQGRNWIIVNGNFCVEILYD